MVSRNPFRQRRDQILMIFFLAKIAEKEDAAENRIKKLKEAKENENRLSKDTISVFVKLIVRKWKKSSKVS